MKSDRQAEDRNAENLLVINKDRGLAEKYTRNWQGHKGHSEPYERR